MSIDLVDDVEAAEELAGTACEILGRIAPLLADTEEGNAARSEALALASTWATYCRPSCGADGEPDVCDDDCCGCPCAHAESWRHADFWRQQHHLDRHAVVVITAAEDLERLQGLTAAAVQRAVLVTDPRRGVVRQAVDARLRAIGAGPLERVR